MMFPLDYQNDIEVPKLKKITPDELQKRLVVRFAEKLKAVKASDIRTEDNKISFDVNFFRFTSNWNILTQIDSGQIIVASSETEIKVSYLISFKRLFIFSTIVIVVAGVWMFSTVPMSIFGKIFLLCGIWLFLTGSNCLMTMVRFHFFVKRIIEEVNGRINPGWD